MTSSQFVLVLAKRASTTKDEFNISFDSRCGNTSAAGTELISDLPSETHALMKDVIAAGASLRWIIGNS